MVGVCIGSAIVTIAALSTNSNFVTTENINAFLFVFAREAFVMFISSAGSFGQFTAHTLRTLDDRSAGRNSMYSSC